MSIRTAFFIVKNRRFDIPYSYICRDIKDIIKDECCICLCQLDDNTVELDCCGHMFHEKCIRESLKINRLCPLCRRNVDDIKDCCIII